MFVDEVVVNIISGDGGGGCRSFRREKFIPEGGPDGGNGGNGGSVVILGSSSIDNLSYFKYKRHFEAQSGKSGSGRNKTGYSGEDLVLKVPLGTQILDFETKNLLFDISSDGQKIILAHGGRGGRGNATFKSSKNQAPERTTPGTKGEEGKFIFRLKLLGDIGIVGFPNAGKSTLINSITNAKSAVADYEFTTLRPVLGMLEMDYKQYVILDIPGLIEGASENFGLGHRFLRHIERCKAILHLIDINSESVMDDYRAIRKELKLYNAELAKKKEIIVFSKADYLSEDELQEKMNLLKNTFNRKQIMAISSASGYNISELKVKLSREIDKIRDKEKSSGE